MSRGEERENRLYWAANSRASYPSNILDDRQISVFGFTMGIVSANWSDLKIIFDFFLLTPFGPSGSFFWLKVL